MALDPSVDANGPAANRSRARPSSAPLSRGDAAASGSRSPFVYMPSPSPVDAFIVRSKQFEFGTCTLNQIGLGSVPPPTMAAVTTSRMPIGYQQGLSGGSGEGGRAAPTIQQTSSPLPGNHIGSSNSSSKQSIVRGPSHVQQSFYASNNPPAQPKQPIGVSGGSAGDETVEDRQRHALADRVAERLVHVQERRQSLQRRIRPTGHQYRSPQTLAGGTNVGASTSSYQVGFDGRSAILHAARSACLSSVSLPTSARKNFYNVDLQAYGVSVVGDARSSSGVKADDTTLLLCHRRTELMLADTPLVGAGLRALLLAAQDEVHHVAGGVLTIAQILGQDVATQRELQAARRDQHTEQHGGTVPTAMYKDGRGANNGGESWRIVYAAAGGSGGPNHQLHQHSINSGGADGGGGSQGMSMAGTSLMPDGFEDVLNGSAVRIRGRPHSAPLSRDDRSAEQRQQNKPIDYLAQLRATSAASKRRPTSAQPARPSTAGAQRVQHNVATSAANRSLYVLDARDSAAKPAAPEWLDNCGLIGVSVDPRYQQSGQHGRQGFFDSSGTYGGAAAGGGGSAAPVAADGLHHHHGHVGSFRGATALSAIREARVKRDSAALEHRKGVLRGGAGFLMFSAAK